MKQLTKSNYKSDKLYPSVVRAVTAILERKLFISPIEILIETDRLDKKLYEDWRFGRIPYLERVTNGGLGMLNRIVKIIQLHCHERGLKPSHTIYNRWGKGPKTLLRFSKSGDAKLEIAYSTHWVAKGEPEIATTAAELPLTESHPGTPSLHDAPRRRTDRITPAERRATKTAPSLYDAPRRIHQSSVQ